ncbi:uncharacterized protein LOC119932275 isoform X2 [Tachyglossus aculeatus]|uniref:uncharacterized protein LOC119932275 isoform X2 n=1 Tax=Tachyglossus aculeatus TaxID=9261 RepID=UPI0018F2A6CA|nr:uncharacterized protein LOC119932275 isoform X2 [Tachyglossus aculeatus]
MPRGQTEDLCPLPAKPVRPELKLTRTEMLPLVEAPVGWLPRRVYRAGHQGNIHLSPSRRGICPEWPGETAGPGRARPLSSPLPSGWGEGNPGRDARAISQPSRQARLCPRPQRPACLLRRDGSSRKTKFSDERDLQAERPRWRRTRITNLNPGKTWNVSREGPAGPPSDPRTPISGPRGPEGASCPDGSISELFAAQ